MTLAFEKFNSIRWARKKLWDKLRDETNESDLITLTRREVYNMLKHYPEDYWTLKIERLYHVYLKEGRREEVEHSE